LEFETGPAVAGIKDMRIIFIADAHLKGTDDPAQTSLVEFLETLTGDSRPDMLVFLGDIFDFWAGFNPIIYNRHLPLLDALETLSTSGVDIIYLEGNHDFNMGTFFTSTLGAEVHADNCRLSIDGKEFFIAHGDAVAMSFGYATWRAFLRSRLFRLLRGMLSHKTVVGIADYLSKRSRARMRGDGHAGIDARLLEFATKQVESGFDVVVLGHSHSAGVQSAGGSEGGVGVVDSARGIYANPGSWVDGTYLVYENGELRVERVGG